MGKADGQVQLLLRPFLQIRRKKRYDLQQLFPAQRMEHLNAVDPVDEFRPEHFADLCHHAVLHFLIFLFLCRSRGETDGLGIHDVPCPHVGGHDHNRIPEIHLTSLRVREMSFVQNLQQQIEHIRIGLLDFIEQHHGIRILADPVRQLTALLIAYIARCGADHLGYRVLLHVFGHVHTDHVLLISEHCLRKCLGKLCFTDTGGAQEQEGADGPVRILQSHPSSSYGSCHGCHGVLLSDDPLVQRILKAHQALAFLLRQATHRHL